MHHIGFHARLLACGILVCCAIVAAIAGENNWAIRSADPLPSLPEPVSNNALAAINIDGRDFVVSFAGLGAGKTHGDTHAKTFVLDSENRVWHSAAPVPGSVGRLASVAVGVKERIFVFGGYTVAADGEEVSTPWVHAFEPRSGTFEARQAMPVPVDDAVAISFQERYVYLISGWHDLGNVNLVQRYDVQEDTWVQATPIDWREVPPHPGRPRYRMAAAGIDRIDGVLFVGGSSNPYNYDGIGYDGRPSSPSAGALLFELETRQWRELATSATATMDHRGLFEYGGGWFTAGGMERGQKVTDKVQGYVVYTHD